MRMRPLPRLGFLLFLIVGLVVCCPIALGQIKRDESPAAERFGPGQTVRYRVGASIKATRGPVQKIVAMVAMPFECDEQSVEVVDEDVSSEIESVDYRFLNEDARQMVINLPYLPGGKEAHAILTFEVTTKTILPPDEEWTAQLQIPEKPDRELKQYLGRSPYIEATSGKVRRLLREILAEESASTGAAEAGDSDPTDEETAADDTSDSDRGQDSTSAEDATQTAAATEQRTPWQQVERIYDEVQSRISYVEGEDKTALQTLKDGSGDCHDISALFVALCRANKVPSRLVWVHEHCYPEFCLADGEGKLHWFPCESAGMRAFGEMPTPRVIMQKGDNFRVPERPRDHLRYASDYLIGVPVRGSGKPSVRYIREQL